MTLSQASVLRVVEQASDRAVLALREFTREAEAALEGKEHPWYFSYRVRVGVK